MVWDEGGLGFLLALLPCAVRHISAGWDVSGSMENRQG